MAAARNGKRETRSDLTPEPGYTPAPLRPRAEPYPPRVSGFLLALVLLATHLLVGVIVFWVTR